ncbi:MAG: histidine kinase [Odoribacter sp.]|nr:histidine kinase [Odoribacter sp.]
MKFFESLTSSKTVLWGSLILSLIIIYPNLGDFIWKLCSPVGSKHRMGLNTASILYFIYRYFFFVLLNWILLKINIGQATKSLKERFWKSFLIILIAYATYVFIGLSIEYKIRLDCFTQIVILQFLIAWLVPVLIGHIYYLTVIQRETEKEIEKLRTENLQSRVDALSNQINPHFFFNSLNGLTALVAANRQEETMAYVTKLSGIFRYILQSEKKGLSN